MNFKATPYVMGNARFTVYAEGCIRLEYANHGRFSPYPSLLVGKKAARPIRANILRRGKRLTVKTSRFTLTYKENGQNFSAENLKIEHANSWRDRRETWYPGKADRGNLGTVVRSLDQWKHLGGGPERFPVEGILSTEGGHFLADEARVYWNTKHDWPENLSHDVWFDGYFFAYGNDYKSALKDFVTVFGRIPMVPRWTFGFWYSRWHAYTDKEFIGLARRYRREKIPIDVMVIDTDWRKSAWGGYDWSPRYFPEPERAIAQLKRMGLKVTLNDHPGYDNYDALPADDSRIPAISRRLGPLPHQGQYACDWSNKAAVTAWRDLVFAPFFKQGIDFWWIDGWVKPPFKGVDSQLWVNRHYFEVTQEKTRKRGIILSRWGGVGSHRYPVQFSGDTYCEWQMLRQQVEFTARSGNLGAVYWSHDVGGFFDKTVEEELYIRWVQFGAMSPVFRTHSCNGIREPWGVSPRAKMIFRKQTRIRYALAPYFYTLAREAYEEGLPLARPLYLDYNDEYPRSLEMKHQYLLGRNMLVVPADFAGDPRTGIFRKRAYFPKGVWYGLETNEVIQGIDDRWIEIPLDRIATYVREGSFVPCQAVRDHLGSSAPEEIQFDYYPSFDQTQFDLYEDDGETTDYERGRFAKTRIQGRRAAKSIEVAIGAPKGRYRNMPARRRYVVRARLEARDRVVRVEVKIGRGAWRRSRHTLTRNCLAGEAVSGHSFCEVRALSPHQPVTIRIVLSE